MDGQKSNGLAGPKNEILYMIEKGITRIIFKIRHLESTQGVEEMTWTAFVIIILGITV